MIHSRQRDHKNVDDVGWTLPVCEQMRHRVGSLGPQRVRLLDPAVQPGLFNNAVGNVTFARTSGRRPVPGRGAVRGGGCRGDGGGRWRAVVLPRWRIRVVREVRRAAR